VLSNEEDAMKWISDGNLQSVNCALVDLGLPAHRGAVEVSSMSGLRIVQEIRQAHRFAGTVLVLTNSREFADGQRALAAGCDGYLCKHAPMAEVPAMLAELKLALRGDIMIVSREMRHVFIREEFSVKEARLMDMLNSGHSWSDIAKELGYKTPKAAANIGYRVFDKLITETDRQQLGADGERKRHKALERWRARLGQGGGAQSPTRPVGINN
jgi:DNA-binding NarL/FixJ family response regulator